jgi:sigma-B regulation protein RsbU (phosphoserine phosphatase)
MLTRIALADVCGHGQAVTDISRWIYEALSARMNTGEGHAVLADLNRLAAQGGYKAMTTAAVATFDRTDWHLDLAYAGHPPIYLRRHPGTRWEAVLLGDGDEQQVANLPLGVLEDAAYEQRRVPLGEGDRILLYTDGLIEARNAGGELFGIERVLQTLEARAADDPKTLKDALLAALWKHTGGDMSHDDVTFMVVEVESGAACPA